uniref:Uncharacterized protein n=1 Tax=Theropithecus gelada TaxID=9565 RepID=A0A8D2EBY8_THEGE
MQDRIEIAQVAHQRQHATWFIDQPIYFKGRLEKTHLTGKMFILSDEEGKNGIILLSGGSVLCPECLTSLDINGAPLVTAKSTIMCASYVQFKEYNHPFDLGLYNEAVKVIHEFPQFYPLGIVQHDSILMNFHMIANELH